MEFIYLHTGKAIGLPDDFLSMPPELVENEENHCQDEKDYNGVTMMPKGGGALQV